MVNLSNKYLFTRSSRRSNLYIWFSKRACLINKRVHERSRIMKSLSSLGELLVILFKVSCRMMNVTSCKDIIAQTESSLLVYLWRYFLTPRRETFFAKVIISLISSIIKPRTWGLHLIAKMYIFANAWNFNGAHFCIPSLISNNPKIIAILKNIVFSGNFF